MGEALVVDFDDEIRVAAGDGISRFHASEFKDAFVILVNTQFGTAGKHALAEDTADGGLANLLAVHRHPGWHKCGQQAGAAVGRAAHNGPLPQGASVYFGLHNARIGHKLGTLHARHHYAAEGFAPGLYSFTLGGLHGDELAEILRRLPGAIHQQVQPVVRELHGSGSSVSVV